MPTDTQALADWSQAPAAWQSYAKTIPQLENMPDNAYDALREKYFQEQVLPAMMKQGANYMPEVSRQAFFEKTERPSRLPHSLEAAKTAASLLANQAAKAFVAPFAGTNAWDAQKMQMALERRGQGLESEATQEWMSPTLAKGAGELVGQAPYWMAGMEGAGAAAKLAKVSPAATRLFNIGAGGIIQGSYDAAKAQNGHRLVEGVGGAAMGAAGVAAFEGLGAFLKGKGMTPEEADAVVATTRGGADPKQEAMAAAASNSSPNLTADINSWMADQIKVADRNGVPKGAVVAEPNARVKIQMTGADGTPYNVGGAVGIKLGDLPAVVGRIAQHLEKGGSITSVLGDVPELHSLLRQFEKLNEARGEYDLSVPLRGQAESVVPTEGVVAPASQLQSLEDLETQAWNAVGSKQVTSPRSLQSAAPQLRLTNKVAKQLFERMYPVVEETPAESHLASSPSSSAGEEAAPVEPSGTPPLGEAPGAALMTPAAEVATKQLGELRGYIGAEEMPHLDKLEVLPNGRVRNRVDGAIYKNVAEAVQAEPKAGAEEPGGSRREFLKKAGGAAAAGVGAPKGQVEGLLKGAEAGNTNALNLINEVLDRAVGDKVAHLAKGFVVLEGGGGASSGSTYTGRIVRSFKGLAELLSGESNEGDLAVTLEVFKSLPKDAQQHLRDEILSKQFGDLSYALWDVSASVLKAVDPNLPDLVQFSKEWYGSDASNLSMMHGVSVKKLLGKSKTELSRLAEEGVAKRKTELEVAESSNVQRGYEKAQVATRPTGMELARTPLGLGEAGEGGVLTRYGANPNAPNTPTPGGWSYKETPQVSRLYGPGMTVGETARASGAPTSMVEQLQGASGNAKGVTYPGSVTASGKPLVVLTEPSRGLIFHEMTHAHVYATGLSPTIDAALESVKPEMIDALQGAFSPKLRQMYGGRVSPEELYTYGATAVRTDDQTTIARMADADGGHEEFLDWVGKATSKLREEVATTPDSLHRRVFERKLNEVSRRASSYIQDMQNGTFNVDGLSLSWEKGKFIAETSDGQSHSFSNRSQLSEWLDRNYNEPFNAPSAVDESAIPKGTPRYAADLPGFTNKKPPIHTDPPSPDLEDEPVFDIFHETHPIWQEGVYRDAWVAFREGDVEEARKLLARDFLPTLGEGGTVDSSFIDHVLHQFERLNKERLSLPGPPSFGAASISGGKTALGTPFGDREPAKGGMMLAWRYFQPFQDWIDIVARKNNWPELSDLFGAKLQGAVDNVESHIRSQHQMLKSTLGQFPPKRQSDLYTYLKASPADRPKVASQFNFTGVEENAIKEFEAKASGLADSYGSSLHNFVRSIAPSLRAKNYDLDTLVPSSTISKEDVAFWKPLLEAGRVDPNDTNLLRLADSWVKGGARKTYLSDTVKEAEKFIKTRNVEGDRLVGDLKGALQRHLDFVKGMPDQSQQVINSAMGHVTELVNSGIAKANERLPERFQIEPIDSIPQDILGKWILYSYAGTIGLRPALPIRAAMQMFITGYPILGGKYLGRGMARMFPAIGEGTASEAYQIADRYGWLLKPRDYGNLYTGEGNIEQSATAKLAQRSLQPLLWGHNAARLAVGWGHVKRFLDAMRYKSDPDQFLSKSALNWLPQFKQQSYLKEIQALGGGDATDLAYRAARDLVDVSQWSYRKGTNPGLYEYGLGRLFGQYGTWPLNYIEFARKLATHPDKGTQIAALTRLALAHGAILKAGEAAGVDTGQWVFSQPMAYGGGPLFQAVRAVPGSLDFETQKGTEARRELVRPLWPVPIFIPGGMAAQQLIDAVNSNSPDIYKILMGFKPLKEGEELKGEHGLLP